MPFTFKPHSLEVMGYLFPFGRLLSVIHAGSSPVFRLKIYTMHKYSNLQLFLAEERQNTQDLLIDNSYHTRITAEIFGLSFDEFVSQLLTAIDAAEHNQELCEAFDKMNELHEMFEDEDTNIRQIVLSETYTLETGQNFFKMKARQLIWDSVVNVTKTNDNVFVDERQDDIIAAIEFWNDWKTF
jgi:uncharacterized protein YuzE